MVQWPKQRAWGWYATLIRTPWFCLKLLRFKPLGRLSLQRHFHRHEIWLILNGGGYLTNKVDTKRSLISCDMLDICVIKKKQWHQFYNPSNNEATYILELQYGKKVTETDIERKTS